METYSIYITRTPGLTPSTIGTATWEKLGDYRFDTNSSVDLKALQGLPNYPGSASPQLIKGVRFDFGTVKGGAHGNLDPLSYPTQPINWSESFMVAADPSWSAPADNPYAKPTENLLADLDGAHFTMA